MMTCTLTLSRLNRVHKRIHVMQCSQPNLNHVSHDLAQVNAELNHQQVSVYGQ